MMTEITVYDSNHSPVSQRQLAETVFERPMNLGLLHQVVVTYQANARQGTSASKGRSDVNYTGRRPYRQKGTGRARQGSFRSPLRRGGGVVFGPHPRDYRKTLSKKLRQEAVRIALSDRLREGHLSVVNGIEVPEPKTKLMACVLKNFELGGKTLVVHDGKDKNLVLSGRNLDGVTMIPARELNALAVLENENLLVTEPALEEIERLWG